MDGYTIDDLLVYLQAVRGESRVKHQEEDIRKAFLQAAVDEIFSKYDWDFNRKVTEIERDSDGYYDVPKDFSLFNRFTLKGSRTYEKRDITVLTERNKLVLRGPTESKLELTYFKKAPNLLTDAGNKVYFPQPMLIADRAYIRLKTAYFPDESSEFESKSSELALRQLFGRTNPQENFKHFSWS